MDKSKNFLKHFFIIGTGTLFNMLLGFITTPLITRLVEPTEYGQYSVFTMYSDIAVMVLCMGLDQALVRFYYENEESESKRALLFKCIKLPVAFSVALSIIFCTLVAFKIIEFEFGFIITVFLCLSTMIQIVYRFSLLLVRLSYQSKLYSSLQILRKLIYVVVALGLLISFKTDNLLMLVIATVFSIFVCMCVSIVAQKNIWDFSKVNECASEVSTKELLTYSYPFIISMGLTSVFQAMDKISLNHYCTYAEVGVYSSTMTLVNIFAIIQTTFNTLWSPMATEYYSRNKDERTFYQKGNQIITTIMFFCGISLILCKDMFSILLGEKYREAAYILPFLIFHPIMYTISETTVMGIAFMKKSKFQILNAGIACLTNIIGNTILVPIYGCKGAAISTGISYIVFFTMRTIVSNKFFYIDWKLPKFYFLTFVVALYALYNTFVSFNIGSIIGYFVCLLVLVVMYRDTFMWEFSYISEHKDALLKKLKTFHKA